MLAVQQATAVDCVIMLVLWRNAGGNGSSLMSGWQPVAQLDDLRLGTMRCVATPKGQLLLVHAQDGTLFAADPMCTHEDAELELGALRGTMVKCPLHGSWFDLRDGAVSDEPATEPLKVYPVRVQDGVIEVQIGS